MTREEYVEPKQETVYFEAPYGNGRWSATEWTIGGDRYSYYVNWCEPYSTLPPHYKLQINYKDGSSNTEVCMSGSIAYSRIMAAVKKYEKKFGINDAEENPEEDSELGHTYFQQTHSEY